MRNTLPPCEHLKNKRLMTRKKHVLSALSFALWPLAATAQGYKIEAHAISGGGASSAGTLVLTGTIGQPVTGFSTGGDHQLKAGFWNVALDVVVIPDESFETWMKNLPEDEKPPEGQRGPQDTPAGDNMTNLLKYALGLRPMTPSADAAPSVALDEGYLTIELDRSQSAAVIFELEGSRDLNTWNPVPFNEDILNPDIGDNREQVQLVTGHHQRDDPKFFLRLVVKMPGSADN